MPRAAISRRTIAVALGVGWGLEALSTALYCAGRSLPKPIEDSIGMLSFFVFPYVLGLPIYVLSQSFLLSELVVLFLCVAAYGVARQLLPPRLSIAQFAGVLLAWGLASAGGFLLLFLFSIGPNPRALAG